LMYGVCEFCGIPARRDRRLQRMPVRPLRTDVPDVASSCSVRAGRTVPDGVWRRRWTPGEAV
jgi:hypothetical protein